MTWRDDNHGMVTRSSEIKCYFDSHSWPMKLSQLHRQRGLVRVATYSLNAEHAVDIFRRRPHDIRIICNGKFRSEARLLAARLPLLEIACRDDMHAKLVLIEPDTVYLGSMNFVKNMMKDAVLGVRGRDIHQHYRLWFDWLWRESEAI
jgi:PLD-like domain